MDGLKLREKIELNFKQGEKVKVSPVGNTVGLDGRGFAIDGELVVNEIKRVGMHIPLDENHNFGKAVGWFDKDSFEVREDGIYASLELNTIGKDLVENKVYRYMSPVYVMGANGMVIGLDCVGLVNRPNLLNNALNEKKEKTKEQKLEELQELKSQIDGLKNEVKALKEAKPAVVADDVKKVEENLRNEVEVLTTAIKEMNSKMQVVFKKVDLEENEKKATLSENDKKVADLLGLSHEEYLKSKEESK